MFENRFTVRIKPQDGESLFSFMLRFSVENGINFFTLWNMVKKTRSHFIQSDDIGGMNFVPINMIEPLNMAYLTGIENEEILKMSFYYLIKKLCGKSNIDRSRFISNMLRDTFCYCPKCLEENPYHRLLWSIRDVSICVKHNMPLVYKCPNCNKEIKIKDLHGFETCPYCSYELLNTPIPEDVGDIDLKWQIWLDNTYKSLLSISNIGIQPHDIATKLLYILNKNQPNFQREVVESSLNVRAKLPSLLQYSRESLSNKRTLHLSFILSILYENNISIEEFLNLYVPNDFVASIRNKKSYKVNQVSCLAPWCKNYMKKGLLVKTGTSLKKRSDGEVYKYYLLCPECGCEYAFDKEDKLNERTYFISGYTYLNKFSKQELGLIRLSEMIGFSQDMLRRCLSYFESRAMFVGECNRKVYFVDELLLHKFIKAVKEDIKINEIKKWSVWESYNHFLFYRYHKDVMMEINSHSHKKYQMPVEDKNYRLDFISNTLENMVQQGKLITIKNVSEEVGVCSETLRYWGCNSLIAQIKEKQRKKRIIELKSRVRVMVDNYLLVNNGSKITSDGIYAYIGIRRNILWRSSPKLTTYIGNVLKKHNKAIYNKIN